LNTKPRLIFTFLSVYIIAAFAWWTYAHIRDNKVIYQQEKTMMEVLCYKATVDVNGAIQQEMFNDTNDIKHYFLVNYPQLEIVFDTDQGNPMDNFLIRPQLTSYTSIKAIYDRKVWMYTLEGIVMVILLFWGIIWIYRSFQNRILLKRQQSNFLLSITHELKTPLTSVKLYLETLRKRKLDAQQTETAINNSLNDIERLRDLVENLLLAAQLDNHRYEPDFREVELDSLVVETIDKYIAPRNLQHRMIKNIEQGIILVADANAITMVVNNLLSNAAKYSSENGVIEVFLRSEGNHIRLSVSNEGPSIPEEDKKNLFTRFYRAGDENTRRSKGTGLGLFIVKNLLNLHKAEITVKNKHPQGTIFDIIFKKDV
jgi:two-component system phosphate regulon sensor histidine kinase PhoR